MNRTALAALAASVLGPMLLAAGCTSTGKALAYDPEGCTLNSLAPSPTIGPWASAKVSPGDPVYRAHANCTSNRALAQMNAARADQQRSTAVTFPPEAPN